MSASMLGIPFDYGRSYQYPREVWRTTRVEIRCAVGPGAALPARTSDPAEDLRPRPRRHIVPAREQNARKIVVVTREFEILRVVLAGILPARNDSRRAFEKRILQKYMYKKIYMKSMYIF